MAEEKSGNEQRGEAGDNSPSGGAGEQQSGDPGRTPGKAEGDEETVEESLRQKES